MKQERETEFLIHPIPQWPSHRLDFGRWRNIGLLLKHTQPEPSSVLLIFSCCFQICSTNYLDLLFNILIRGYPTECVCIFLFSMIEVELQLSRCSATCFDHVSNSKLKWSLLSWPSCSSSPVIPLFIKEKPHRIITWPISSKFMSLVILGIWEGISTRADHDGGQCELNIYFFSRFHSVSLQLKTLCVDILSNQRCSTTSHFIAVLLWNVWRFWSSLC